MGLFSFIGTVGKALFGGGGDQETGTSTAKIDYEKMIEKQKEEFEEKITAQAEQSRKTMMFMGIGAVILIMMMFLFMKK